MNVSLDLPRRKLGKTDLNCHPVGFGCYRICRGNRRHEEALRAYLDRGGNLIDTSANYGDGLSEELVGLVLKDYPREKIIVITKGGYIQGENMKLAQKENFPETVRYGEGLWHCIHPKFLQSQIGRSFARLQQSRVDVYLLHNPEYFLTDKVNAGTLTPADQEEFYRRIREAFHFLESQVSEGTISCYGISSNNFGGPLGDPTTTLLDRCLREAQSVSHDHHFRVIQLPMNLYEPGGALEGNCGGKSVAEFCQSEELGVLVNRPLNAFHENRLIRLADFRVPGHPTLTHEALRAMLNSLRQSEQRVAQELNLPLLRRSGLAGLLEEVVPKMQSQSHWEQSVGTYVIQPLQSWLQEAQLRFGRDMRWQSWVQDLAMTINPLFDDIGRFVSASKHDLSNSVRQELRAAGYPDSTESLSQMAMNVLLNVPGVDCVLNGMRRIEYVEEAIMAAKLPRVNGLQILREFPSSADHK